MKTKVLEFKATSGHRCTVTVMTNAGKMAADCAWDTSNFTNQDVEEFRLWFENKFGYENKSTGVRMDSESDRALAIQKHLGINEN